MKELSSVALLSGLAERRGNGDLAQRSVELVREEPAARREPIHRSQLEDASFRPTRQDSKQIAQILLGIESGVTRRPDEREPRAGHFRRIVGAKVHPILTTDGHM